MSNILMTAKLEIRQQFRSLTYWLLLLFTGFMAFDGSRQSVNLFETLAWAGTAFTLLVLLAGLWALNSAQLEKRLRVSELLDATPSLMWQSLLGRWLALATLGAVQVAVFICVLAARAVIVAGGFSLSTLSAFFFVVYLPWLLMGITIGFVTGTHFKSFFASIPIVAGWWAIIMAGVDSGILARRLPGPWAEIIDVTGALPVTASAVFGFLPFYRLALNRLMQLSAIVVLLTLSMLVYKRYRENRFSIQVATASALAIALSVTGVALFYRDIGSIRASAMARFVNYGDKNEGAMALYPSWAELALENPLEVMAHSLDLEFKPKLKSLTASSLLHVVNPTAKPVGQFVFTLNRTLAISSISLNSIPLELTKSPFGWYSVSLPSPVEPGSTAAINIEYSGKIEEWTFRYDGRDPELIAFINDQGVFLPASLYWYPQAGAHEVYGLLPIGKPSLPAAVFTVDIRGLDKTIALNLPASGSGWQGYIQSLDLVAGNFDSLTNGNVTLVYTKGHEQEAEDVAERLKLMYDLCSTYLGPSNHSHITAVTIPRKFYGHLSPQRSGTLAITDSTIAAQRINMHDLWNNQSLFSSMVTLWFYSGYDYSAPGESRDAAVAVVSYLWSLYRDQLGTQSTDIHAENDARFSGGWLNPGQQWSVTGTAINRVWLELYELGQTDQAVLKARMQELVKTIKAGGR